MDSIQQLLESLKKEAKREEFPVDVDVYKSADLDPLEPILYYGNLESQVCFFARDLGKDEVKARQPLYGAAGRLVRQGVYKAIFDKQTSDTKELQKAADKILLSNTVPYKPPGNKAYANSVKKRFRPFLEQLLVMHWTGDYIITLGSEAFKWYYPYGDRKELDAFFKQGDARYESEVQITLTAKTEEGEQQKQVTLAPLPHPSPLNQKYYHLFPEMLEKRLAKLKEKLQA